MLQIITTNISISVFSRVQGTTDEAIQNEINLSGYFGIEISDSHVIITNISDDSLPPFKLSVRLDNIYSFNFWNKEVKGRFGNVQDKNCGRSGSLVEKALEEVVKHPTVEIKSEKPKGKE